MTETAYLQFTHIGARKLGTYVTTALHPARCWACTSEVFCKMYFQMEGDSCLICYTQAWTSSFASNVNKKMTECVKNFVHLWYVSKTVYTCGLCLLTQKYKCIHCHTPNFGVFDALKNYWYYLLPENDVLLFYEKILFYLIISFGV